jgi:hypothetical protein
LRCEDKEKNQRGMGLPHSTTLARFSKTFGTPQGFGVRQPHAAFPSRPPLPDDSPGTELSQNYFRFLEFLIT